MLPSPLPTSLCTPPKKKPPAHAHTAKIDRSTKGYVDSRLDTYDDVTLSAVQLSRFFYVEQDEDIPEDKCAQLIAEYEPARTDGLMGVDGFARLLLGRHGQAYNPDHCETVYQVRACVCICSCVCVHVCVQIMCVVFGDVVSAEVCVCVHEKWCELAVLALATLTLPLLSDSTTPQKKTPSRT